MTVETRERRSYTQEEKDAALIAVASNAGNVKPTAAKLGVPHMTVADWWKHYLEQAHSLAVRTKEGETLADRFLAVAIAAQDRVIETVGSASAYQAALIEGINLDKYLLLTGRPTSRTEVLKARYVEPEDLRKLSARVIDVQALPPKRRRKSRQTSATDTEGAE